eukprot:gnl/MRDRNA2_/MRDRNA2_82556_c0_seq3.p1 gnl/MRDRNA2_/MRDRNA2_82556_c0~~gnl/MRDRNA2_/MRDRNA2_82556_c0_seq3.p1  ORF type:complete len:336 (-),score=80.18 gnl/MRDRNA2_/MRDRNA2_82556_c0_seq3:192-1199(-)
MASLFSEEALSALTSDVVEKVMQNDDAASTASGISSNPASLPSSPGVSEPVSSASPTKSPISPWTPTVAPESLKDLPSLGSLGHFAGLCSRCCFHAKGRCQNGYDCRFCHFDHEKRARKKKIGVNARGLTGTPVHQQLENRGFHDEAWGMSVSQIPQYVSAPPTNHSMAGLPIPQSVPAPPGLEAPLPPPPPVNFPMVTLPPVLASCEFSAPALPPTVPPASPPPALLGTIAQPPAEPPQVEALLEASTVNSVADWPVAKVMDWLCATGLGHISKSFEEHRITGDVLLELTSSDLEEIGVHALGDKKRVLRAVTQLKVPGAPASCPPPPSWQAVF